jgi:type IV secretory pathway VirB2 component (pilin)
MIPAKATPPGLSAIEDRVRAERPDRLPVLAAFRDLERRLRRMRLLAAVPPPGNGVMWWPVVVVAGSPGTGKTAFAATRFGFDPAPGDRILVLRHGPELDEPDAAAALSADPRVPWAALGAAPETGDAIPSPGEVFAARALPAEALKGLVWIDLPGFDGDPARRPVLARAQAVAGTADLVLVFLDARIAEPAAQTETLAFIASLPPEKRLLVLDRIETPLPEDGPDPAPLAWAQALESAGVTDALLVRREAGEEGTAINGALDRVRHAVDTRALDAFDRGADAFENTAVPAVARALARRRRTVIAGDVLWAALLAALAVAAHRAAGSPPLGSFLAWLLETPAGRALPLRALTAIAIVAVLLAAGHLWLRAAIARRIAAGLETNAGGFDLRAAFRRSARFPRSILASAPIGWSPAARRSFRALRESLAALRAANAAPADSAPPPPAAGGTEP